MAIAYDSVNAGTVVAGTGDRVITFLNISLPANSLLVVAANSNGGSNTDPTITVAGGSLTWSTDVTAAGSGTTGARAIIATAFNAGSQTATITSTTTGHVNGDGDTSAVLYVLTGTKTSSYIGATDTYVANDNDPNDTAGEAQIITTAAGSVIIWTANEWEAIAAATPDITNATETVDQNYLESGKSTHYTVHTAPVAVITTTTRLVINVTGDGDWTCSGVEILAATAATVDADGAEAVTAARTGTAAVDRPASGNEAVTAAPVGTAAVDRPTSGVETVTSTLAGTAAVDRAASGNEGVTVTSVGTAALDLPATGTRTTTVAADATAAVDRAAAGLLAVTATLAGDAAIDGVVDGARAVTAVLAGTAAVDRAASGSLALTATTVGAATTERGVSGNLTVTVTLSAATVNPTGSGAPIASGTLPARITGSSAAALATSSSTPGRTTSTGGHL